MESLLNAIALVLIIEGLLPFLSPARWRSVFEKVLQLSEGQIRFYGLVSIALGLGMMLFLG